MKLSNLSEPIYSASDIIEEIYRGNLSKISLARIDIADDDYIKYVDFLQENQLDDWPLPEPFVEKNISLEIFDRENQNDWFMPKEYRELDIKNYLYSLCETEQELERVKEEIRLFDNHGMIDLLRFLKFLVDIMRSNNILWGVGRGSSVASYCLYLLGIHKINSLKYHLDIKEFLRGE